MKKPSERIIEIHKALKILDGQNPDDRGFGDPTFFETAIMDYLDERELGTPIQQRTTKPK
jgi:hypothetical protein